MDLMLLLTALVSSQLYRSAQLCLYCFSFASIPLHHSSRFLYKGFFNIDNCFFQNLAFRKTSNCFPFQSLHLLQAGLAGVTFHIKIYRSWNDTKPLNNIQIKEYFSSSLTVRRLVTCCVALRAIDAVPKHNRIALEGVGFNLTHAFIQTGIRACVAGGKLVVVGLGGEEANLPIAAAACKEVDIIGSFRYANTVSLLQLLNPQYNPSFDDSKVF